MVNELYVSDPGIDHVGYLFLHERAGLLVGMAKGKKGKQKQDEVRTVPATIPEENENEEAVTPALGEQFGVSVRAALVDQ